MANFTPEYYPIAEAAKLCGLSVERLIHLGAWEKLNLYWLVSKRFEDVNLTVIEQSMNPKINNLLTYNTHEGLIGPLLLLPTDFLTEVEINGDYALFDTFEFVPKSVQKKESYIFEQSIEATLKEPICFGDMKVVVRHHDLEKLITPSEQPLKESDRRHLLKMILAMAMDKYNYNPTIMGNIATSKNEGSIKKSIKTHLNTSADEKVIIRLLKEARDELLSQKFLIEIANKTEK